MTEQPAWILDEELEGQYTLIAPNGIALFTVSLETLEMLARMFQSEVEDADELADPRKVPYVW